MRLSRWIFWVLLAIGVFVFLSALGVYLILRGLDLAPPPVTSGSTLSVRITGSIPEDSLYELGSSFFRIERLTFRDIVSAIERAKEDSRFDSLLVQVESSSLGWARAEELRNTLVDFKSSGKTLVSYVELGGNVEYFVASAADRVYMNPQSVLDLRGIQAEVTFMRSTLDKLGVEAEFERIGSYKNAPDVYTRETLSGPHREVLESIVDDLYVRFVESLARARNKSTEDVERLLDQGPFDAQATLDSGWVDGLLYRDEVEALLTPEGERFREVTAVDYPKQEEDGFRIVARPKIALIYGIGMITGGESLEDPFAGRVMGSDTLTRAFKEARDDDSIRAVVFRIDSPGGSDVASDVIWRAASLTMKEKPVVVSMSDMAASGGYWVATASNAIVAEPTTLTGSIGIYGGKFNLRGLYEKVGLNKERVMRGQSADFWSDTRPFTEAEKERFRGILEEGYRRFLTRVAEGRHMEPGEVDAIGRGRVWTGAQALDLGLVDELGGLDRALSIAKEKAGISVHEEVSIDVYPRKRSYIELILSKLVQDTPGITGRTLLDPRQILERSRVVRLLLESERLAIVPFHIRLE